MLNRSKNIIRSYLGFSKKELNGIFILFLIMLIILITSFLLPFFEQDRPYDFEAFKEKAQQFRASAIKIEASKNDFNDYSSFKPRNTEYFEFNPNGLSTKHWLKLGLSQKQISVIHNYEAKGGKFFKKEDLKKIYSITPEQYKLLEPYIRISDVGLERKEVSVHTGLKLVSTSETSTMLLIELNSADSLKLESVSGIGPVFASRIIRFRNRLGGFYTLEQLKEVYGIDSLKFERLKKNFKINKELIQKIDLNTATFEVLRRHPYLNYKQMNAILQFRSQHGSFKSIDELKKVEILDEEIIRKIEPYIVLNP